MKRRIFIVILIFFVLFTTCSCNESIDNTESSNQNTEASDENTEGKNYEKLYQEALLQIDDLNTKLKKNSQVIEALEKNTDENDYEKLYQEALSQIKELDSKLNKLEMENRKLINAKKNYPLDLTITLEFDWLKNESWDEIFITEYYPAFNAENCEITRLPLSTINENLLKINIGYIFPIIYNNGHPVDPGERGRYRYEFVKEEESYIIDVYDTFNFSYNGEFYKCLRKSNFDDLFGFGRAFVPDRDQRAFNAINDYLSLIYHSPICIGEKVYPELMMLKSRNQIVAKALKTFTSVPQPDDIEAISPDDLIETMSYYGWGESLKMIIYKNYINILYKEQDVWLANSEDVGSILTIYGAN